MNLYEVTNGYQGETYTHVLVMASTVGRAQRLASVAFQVEAEEQARITNTEGYKEDYWREDGLKVEGLYYSAGDHSPEWTSAVR